MRMLLVNHLTIAPLTVGVRGCAGAAAQHAAAARPAAHNARQEPNRAAGCAAAFCFARNASMHLVPAGTCRFEEKLHNEEFVFYRS